jgi:hypothetical protein
MIGPIDKIRNSGFGITLPADTGGITDMGEINGALHIIGGSTIYRVQLADEIDPKRTNIAVLRNGLSLCPANFDDCAAAVQE